MISALASGILIRTPKSGTSASGTTWANTTIRCPTGQNREGEAESSFVNVLCFGDVAEKLAKLDKGDSISCQGSLKQGQYEKDGKIRHTLEIVAQAILSPYQLQKKRGDSHRSRRHSSDSDREQNLAYDKFAKGVKQSSQASEDFNDEVSL